MKAISKHARLLGVFLTTLTAWTVAWCQVEPAPLKLPPGAVQAQANGKIQLLPAAHSPVYVEFDGSQVLTQALAEALRAGGFDIAKDRAAARSTLVIRGDLVLQGGPVFYKGVKVSMGEATEKSVKAAADGRSASAAEGAQAAVSLALESGAARSAINPFWRGLALGRMAEVLGDATGVRGAFNKALTGDPRGICLSRCEDWNKVKQTAYAFVSFTGPDGRQDIRVLATATAETLAPEEIIDAALARAVGSIEILDAAPWPR
jgi:hypothetical protein